MGYASKSSSQSLSKANRERLKVLRDNIYNPPGSVDGTLSKEEAQQQWIRTLWDEKDLPDEEKLKILRDALKDDKLEGRAAQTAIGMVARASPESMEATMKAVLNSKDDKVRYLGVYAYATFAAQDANDKQKKAAYEAIKKVATEDKSSYSRNQAIEQMGEMADREIVPRDKAVKDLRTIGKSMTLKEKEESGHYVDNAVIQSQGGRSDTMATKKDLKETITNPEDTTSEARINAINSMMYKNPTKSDRAMLAKIAKNDPDPEVRKAAKEARSPEEKEASARKNMMEKAEKERAAAQAKREKAQAEIPTNINTGIVGMGVQNYDPYFKKKMLKDIKKIPGVKDVEWHDDVGIQIKTDPKADRAEFEKGLNDIRVGYMYKSPPTTTRLAKNLQVGDTIVSKDGRKGELTRIDPIRSQYSTSYQLWFTDEKGEMRTQSVNGKHRITIHERQDESKPKKKSPKNESAPKLKAYDYGGKNEGHYDYKQPTEVSNNIDTNWLKKTVPKPQGKKPPHEMTFNEFKKNYELEERERAPVGFAETKRGKPIKQYRPKGFHDLAWKDTKKEAYAENYDSVVGDAIRNGEKVPEKVQKSRYDTWSKYDTHRFESDDLAKRSR